MRKASMKKDDLFPSLAGRGRGVGLLVTLLLCCFVTLSCGSGSGTFKLKGKFKNLNQGEFYIYSSDGAATQIDTIRVDRGSFVYTMTSDDPATLMLVFPNFSQQPVFAMPGKTVEMKGDASNLKDMEVSGTKDNELMTAFRRQTSSASPPEVRKAVGQFVADHPDSEVGVYLVRNYFMQSVEPDYREAVKLLSSLSAAQPKNIRLSRLFQKARELSNTTPNSTIPDFSATDYEGQTLTKAALSGAKVAVVTTYSSWHFDSQNMLRQLRRTRRKAPGKMKVLSIYLDGNIAEMKRLAERDTIDWPIIADPSLFEGSAIRAFGLSFVGDNLIYHNGRLVGSHLKQQDLIHEVEKLL